MADHAARYHNTAYEARNIQPVISVQIIEGLATVEEASGANRAGFAAYSI